MIKLLLKYIFFRDFKLVIKDGNSLNQFPSKDKTSRDSKLAISIRRIFNWFPSRYNLLSEIRFRNECGILRTFLESALLLIEISHVQY